MIKNYHFTRISSTNDYARQIIENESEVIVTADHQTNGRGRKERQWQGDFGANLFFTYAVNHKKIATFKNIFSFLTSTSLMVINTLREFAPKTEFIIKYPNDILARNDKDRFKKISGILTEHIFQGNIPLISIIGIGVNINQKEFPPYISSIACSLAQLGYNVNLSTFTNILQDKFEGLYLQDEIELFEKWKSEINIKGKLVTRDGSNKIWKAEEILLDGRLLISSDTDKAIIDDGETIRYGM